MNYRFIINVEFEYPNLEPVALNKYARNLVTEKGFTIVDSDPIEGGGIKYDLDLGVAVVSFCCAKIQC